MHREILQIYQSFTVTTSCFKVSFLQIIRFLPILYCSANFEFFIAIILCHVTMLYQGKFFKVPKTPGKMLKIQIKSKNVYRILFVRSINLRIRCDIYHIHISNFDSLLILFLIRKVWMATENWPHQFYAQWGVAYNPKLWTMGGFWPNSQHPSITFVIHHHRGPFLPFAYNILLIKIYFVDYYNNGDNKHYVTIISAMANRFLVGKIVRRSTFYFSFVKL